MRIQNIFRDVRYRGVAEGDRNTYHVFESADNYLVVAPNRSGLYVSIVERETLDVITKKYGGRQVTVKHVIKTARRPDLFDERFAALNALYALVGLGRAKKLKKRDGKALLFKIR